MNDLKVKEGYFVLSEDNNNPNPDLVETLNKINQNMEGIYLTIANRLSSDLKDFLIEPLSQEELLKRIQPDSGFYRDDLSTNLFFNIDGNVLDGQVRVSVDKDAQVSDIHIEG